MTTAEAVRKEKLLKLGFAVTVVGAGLKGMRRRSDEQAEAERRASVRTSGSRTSGDFVAVPSAP